MASTYYRVEFPGERRSYRVFPADSDQIAWWIGLGLVKAIIRRNGGNGVTWRMFRLKAGPRSEIATRIHVG